MARPTKLTPEITDKICELLERGLPIHLVCDYVGIVEPTFYGWVNKGSKDKPNKEFLEFLKRVNTAKAKVVDDYLKRLEGYSQSGSVYATTWFLERRCPGDFGRKENLNIKSQNENLNVELKPSEEIEQEILSKLSRIASRTGQN